MQKNLYGMLKLAKMQQKAYENAIPIHATFEITPRCGFNCRMCYVHLPVDRISKVGDGRELTGDEWLEIGRQAVEMGVFSICITGGTQYAIQILKKYGLVYHKWDFYLHCKQMLHSLVVIF